MNETAKILIAKFQLMTLKFRKEINSKFSSEKISIKRFIKKTPKQICTSKTKQMRKLAIFAGKKNKVKTYLKVYLVLESTTFLF